ncbi:MAG: hypothetical protein J5654_11120 [Victivallales bacterium]|nr:hypothetical protein [Victivallales bacterium]
MTSRAFADLEATIEKLPPFQLMQLHIKIGRLLDQFAEPNKTSGEDDQVEVMRVFDSFAGSVSREINEKQERADWRSEKYESVD